MKQARILICNDDGINAEGIRVLEQAALSLSDDVWVVAPADEQSGKAHSFTAKGELIAKRIDNRHFTVNGTPTDCMLYAFNVLLKEHKPDFVFSGVNHGSNLGFDVVYSGTAGVAIEGTLQGVKSYSFSLFGAKNGSDFWPTVLKYLPEIVKKTAFEKWPALTFLNVNFPECLLDDVKGIKVAELSSRKIGDTIDVMEQTAETCRFKIGYARKGVVEPDSDTQVVSDGFISITPVRVDVTAYDALSDLPF